MKLFASLYFSIFFTFAQILVTHAQVHITYKTSYITEGDSSTLDPHGSSVVYNEYWIGDGFYSYITDAGPEWITVYRADENTMEILETSGNITSRDAGVSDYKLLSLEVIDSVFTYKGYEAFLMKGKNEYGSFERIYSVEQFFDPSKFSNHKYAHWSDELVLTKGGLLLKGTQIFNGDKQVMEFTTIESVNLDQKDFTLKHFRKFWEGRNQALIDELNRKLSSKSILNEFDNAQIRGKLIQSGISFPFELTFMPPHYLRMQMDFMNTTFLMLQDEKYSTTYNPMENQVTRTVKNSSENGENSLFNKLLRNEVNPESDMRVRYVNDLQVDSLMLRRVVLENDDQNQTLFFDKKSGLLKLFIDPTTLEWYLDYQLLGEYLFPRVIVSEDDNLRMDIRELSMNVNIDEKYFALPDSLKPLIQDNTPELTAEDYFNLAEKQSNYTESPDSLNKAITNYKLALEKKPNSDVYLNQLGNVYYRKGDYFRALANYQLATEKNPDDYIIWQNLASSKYKLEQYESALEDINRAIALNNTDEGNFDWRGEIHYSLNQLEASKNDFAKGYALAPDNMSIAGKLGILFFKLEQYDSAILYLSKADSLGTMSGNHYNYRGLAYFQSDQYNLALADFEKVIDIAPSLTIAFYNRAYTLSKLGRSDDAIAAYEEIIARDSTDANAIDDLGMIYYNLQDYISATVYFKRAIDLESGEAIYHDHLGNSYYHQMKYTQAIDAYTRSINLYPDDPETYYNRGMAKIQINNNFDGCKDLKQASEMGYENAQTQFNSSCDFMDE